jgi:3-methyladenine DNA glycosylase AlkC
MPDALKDSLYSRQSFEDVAAAIEQVYPSFDREAFFALIYDDSWEQRTLIQRMRHIPVVLQALLPPDYRAALEILKQAAPSLRQHGFHLVSFSEFVALYGLDDWGASLPALAHLTQFASSEFAVRPFILKDSARMIAQMLEWTDDENEHVRRLASEGSRPRLPWGMAFPAFKKDPSPILPILERLKNDTSEYVRRSVANNLNDIAKDNPAVVIEVLRRWQADADKNVQWIIQRALRSLIKAGHAEALALLGYTNGVEVTVKSLTLSTDTVSMGKPFNFSAEIESQGSQPQNLVIDYVVYFMKANGRQAPKVFKLTKAAIQPGETLKIEKKVTFQPITTRVYYAGEHGLALKINGEESQRATFHLVL